MPAAAVPLLVVGSTGRLGGLLRRLWPFALRDGLRPVWQARDGRPGCLHWDVLRGPAPPWAGGVLLSLAGGRADPAAEGPLALAVLAAAAAQGARHVFLASSGAVYGPGLNHAEDAAPAPGSAYAAGKVAMEAAVAAWRAAHPQGPGVTVLRIGNVAGADALLGRLGADEAVLDPVEGRPGGPERSYIGPQSLAAVLGRLAGLAAGGAALPPALNIAAPIPVSMAALLDAAGHPWRFGPANPAVVPALTLDTRRLQALVRLPPQACLPRVIVQEWRTAGALR
jgi:hypothetical protein